MSVYRVCICLVLYKIKSKSTGWVCWSDVEKRSLSPSNGHCLPQTVTVSLRRSLSPSDDHCLPQTVTVSLKRSLSTSNGHCLPQTVTVSLRRSLSPSNGHCLPQTITVSLKRSLSVSNGHCLPQTVTVSLKRIYCLRFWQKVRNGLAYRHANSITVLQMEWVFESSLASINNFSHSFGLTS